MRYAVLIYQNETIYEGYGDADLQAALIRHRVLQNQSIAAGHFVETNRLGPSRTATTLRRNNGELTVTDGPFAETKELLIGFYIFDCDTLDEVIDYAGQIAHGDTATIEIRPIEYSQAADGTAIGNIKEAS